MQSENSPDDTSKLSNITDIICDLNQNQLAEAGSPQSIPADVVVRQATTDEHVIALWLHGRSSYTQTAYAADIQQFFKAVDKKLLMITLGDLQAYADALSDQGLKPASCHRKLAAVKSLISFSHKIGYLRYDVSKPLRLPKFKDTLSERILSETEVHRIIAAEPNPRNHLMLRILYAGGIRVSELCRLKWSDLQPRETGGGQMTIFGKGAKTNNILIPEPLWTDIMTFRNNTADPLPLFLSRKGGHLRPAQVWCIVKKAAKRAGISKAVSPHWMRHAHCSHSLDRGASIALVSATVGHSSIATTGRYLHARPSDSSSRYLDV